MVFLQVFLFVVLIGQRFEQILDFGKIQNKIQQGPLVDCGPTLPVNHYKVHQDHALQNTQRKNVDNKIIAKLTKQKKECLVWD